MCEEKKEWLREIGAAEFPEPVKYIYSFPEYRGAFNLSERYIDETPLEELKAQYLKNKAMAEDMVRSGTMTGGFHLNVVHP
ncbi:MAG: hypothetical protein LUD16_12805 [Lachnospiraceae bacterium]|nr:hypothetical protein [Lachnospiraceae bacterium]